jgi:hypothetical protein
MTNSAKAVEAMRAGTETAMTTCVESIDRQENYQLRITASRATTKWRLIQRTRSPRMHRLAKTNSNRFQARCPSGPCHLSSPPKIPLYPCFLRSQFCPFSRVSGGVKLALALLQVASSMCSHLLDHVFKTCLSSSLLWWQFRSSATIALMHSNVI